MKRKILLSLSLVTCHLSLLYADSVIVDANGNVLNSKKIIFKPTSAHAGLNSGSLAGDPSSLANGDLWYNSTSNQFKARINGVSVALGAGGGGGVTDGDKGDITVSGAGTIWNVDSGAINFSELAGRSTSAQLPLGAQLFDNAGTPKLALDLNVRKAYGTNGTSALFWWNNTFGLYSTNVTAIAATETGAYTRLTASSVQSVAADGVSRLDLGAGAGADGIALKGQTVDAEPIFAVDPTSGSVRIGSGMSEDGDGNLDLYRANLSGVGHVTPDLLTALRTQHLPDKNGTFAMTSDLPTSLTGLATRNFSDLQNIPSSNLIYVDGVNGHDSGPSIGLINRSDRPFATITAANAAASSGTVWVFPSIYDEKNIIKNGLNYHFIPGAVVQSTTTAQGGIIDDSSFGQNGAIVSTITGAAKFIRQFSNSDTLNKSNTINLTNSGSDVRIVCDTIQDNTSGTGANETWAIRHANGALSISARKIIGNGVIWWSSGDSHIVADTITGTNATLGSEIYSSPGGSDTTFGSSYTSGHLWIESQNVSLARSGANGGATLQGSSLTPRVWIATKGEFVGNVVVSGARNYIVAEKIDGKVENSATSSGELWVTTQKHTSTNSIVALLNIDSNAGKTWYVATNMEAGSASRLMRSATSGSNTYVSVLNGVTTLDTADAILVTGGNLTIDSGTIDNSSGTTHNPINCSGGTVTVKNAQLIAASGRNDIVQSSSGTVNVINGRGSNTNGTFATSGTINFLSTNLRKDANLSDLTDASAARTNLGLAIGTNVQAYDADLDALAALSGTHTLYYRSAANTWSAVTIGIGLDFTGATLSATGGGGSVDDTAFASSWNGMTGTAPSKNAIYDWAHAIDPNDNGRIASTEISDFDTSAPTSSGKIPIWDNTAAKYIPGDPLVQGLLAEGSTSTENPVSIGGYNTAGTPAIHGANVINAPPGGTEYGIVTRPIPSGTQATSQADPAVTSGNITAADAASTAPASLIAGQSLITGTPTANSSVSATLSGTSSYSVQLSGTWVGTVQFEKSMDGGTTWVSLGMTGIGTTTVSNSIVGTGANSNALLHGNSANLTNVRVRCTAYTSGTCAVKIQPGYGVFTVLAATTAADGSNVTLGAKGDAKSTATDTTAVSAMSVLKEISAMEQAPASRAVTNAGTFAVQAASTEADGANTTLGAKGDAKSTATDTTAVSAMAVLKEISAMEQAPASRAVTNAGTFAVQAATTAADGSNVTLGAKGDAKSTATDTTAVSAMSVLKEISAMEQAPASRAVTNAGTFAVQAASTEADGANTTLGAKGDAKSTATDTTAVSAMAVLKEISAMEQAPASRAVTNAGTFAVQPKGSSATNVAIADNPVNIGAQAVTSENSAITTSRQAQLVSDAVGKLIVLPYANPENFVSGAITTAMTGTTSTSLIAAPAAGLRNYITQITVSNAHATVGTDIIIQDGSGGTTLYTIPAAAAYGGATITFPTPLRQPTTATAIFCANVTTGASTKVSASGYKGN